jgi:hypothetical protein
MGLEPGSFSLRLKLLLLTRLIPLCEHNYNLVELGPRETGKSYAFPQLSPSVILLTGPTTVANLFYNLATNKLGLVGLWDAVAFDEVADLQSMPKEVVTALMTYCESGAFARGRDSLSANASTALFGNTNQPVDVMVRSSHLFVPMPEVIRGDLAFLDRLHFYLPGWEVPKMKMEFFTAHYGLVVDYLEHGQGVVGAPRLLVLAVVGPVIVAGVLQVRQDQFVDRGAVVRHQRLVGRRLGLPLALLPGPDQGRVLLLAAGGVEWAQVVIVTVDGDDGAISGLVVAVGGDGAFSELGHGY